MGVVRNQYRKTTRYYGSDFAFAPHANYAYQKALKHIDCDDYMPDELIKQVLAYDRKLHPLKDLFYPKV